MGLASLPEEVFYGYIFCKLRINDILRFRRVCKSFKPFADAYLRLNHVTQEREINTGDHSFAEFIRRDLPSSSIYLNNSDVSFFENPDVPLFLEKYGDQITHLRVKHFGTCVTPAEDKFYLAMKNLQHLELMHIDASGRDCRRILTLNRHKLRCEPTYIPIPLQNLKTLKFDGFKSSGANVKGYCYDLTKFCHNLEDLKHFRFLGTVQSYGNHFLYVERQLNVLEAWFDRNIINAGDLSTLLFNWDMDLVEKFKMTTIKRVVYSRNLFESYGLPDWPNLKELEINIDSDLTCGDKHLRVDPEPALDLLLFLLESMQHTKLSILKLYFDRQGTCEPEMKLPCPREVAVTVVNNCENLKVLHLLNWQGSNKALSQFWTGLEKLEEVTLEKCKRLWNTAFLGKRIGDPAFLKLKNLRKFCLLGLDHMPKVTDTVFHLVFKHLKIKEFCITSDKPIASVSIHGIRDLTKGPFQNSVDKFPFTGWSLESVDKDEWNELKSEFRATFML